MSKKIICDLDGTLFNIEERRRFIEKEPKDWKSFSNPDNILKDEINNWCVKLLQAMSVKGYTIYFLTGRMRKTGVCEATCEMIRFCDIGGSWTLHMREDKDYRPDTVIKKEMLDRIGDKEDILFAIDDRKSVVDMWRENGIVCLQCAEGNF